MKFLNKLFLSVLFFGTMNLSAQDIHFTNFTLSPVTFNPALSGAFEGTLRVGGNFRGQWLGSLGGYQTYDPTVDAPIPFMIKNRHWIGAGISMVNDKQKARISSDQMITLFPNDEIGNGLLNLNTNQFKMSLAFHLSLDKKITKILSFGGQYIASTRKLQSPSGAVVDPEFLATGSSKDFNSLTTSSGTSSTGVDKPLALNSPSDWIFGVNFISRSKSGEFSIGLSSAHVFKNNTSLRTQTDYDQPMRLTGLVSYKGMMNKKYKIQPALLVQSTSEGFEVSTHALLGFKIKPESEYWLNGGLGLRTGTLSPQVLMGVDFKTITARLAFDIPINGVANAPGFQNAFELGVQYVWVRSKIPNPDPIIYCPRL